MKFVSIFLFFSFFLCSSSAQLIWTQLNSSNLPLARYASRSVYVPSSNSMLIFGGQGSSAFLNDLWSYSISSNSWTQLNSSTSPSVRAGHTAIYLSSSNSMLVFGGYTGGGWLNELWSYNISSNSWTQLNSSTSPSVRSENTAIYLSSSNSMLVFGGYTGASWVNDLWSYNISSNTWVQLNPPNPLPSARAGHTAVYVSSSNSMLVFGGYNGASWLNDLWSYNISSNTWSQLNPPNPLPPGRFGHVAIYDSSNSMFIFGGDGNYNYFNDLWEYSSPPQVTTAQQTTVQQTTVQQTTVQQITSQETTSHETTNSPVSQGVVLKTLEIIIFFILLFI